MQADPLGVTLRSPERPSAGLRANLLDLPRGAIAARLADLGEPSYRAEQIMKWVYHHGETDFSAMSNLSKRLRGHLGEALEVRVSPIVREERSTDGTIKWLIEIDRDNCIESVYIPDLPRGTLCVSSQVGCALNCTFCSTARQGFNRNLSTGEIVSQLYFATRRVSELGGAPITNVVLMGMGEPLLNFDNVVGALRIMLDDCAFGLARKRVTLSTAGVVPGIRKLRERCPVSLAVSLHAPEDALRDQLVPLNRSFPIRELMAACRSYLVGQHRQKITFEYVMLDGVNDHRDQARALVKLLRDMPAKVNLIPFNPFSGAGFQRSSDASIDAFREVLVAGGLMTITRKTRGDDIDAACGQLAGKVLARARRMREGRDPVRRPAGTPLTAEKH